MSLYNWLFPALISFSLATSTSALASVSLGTLNIAPISLGTLNLPRDDLDNVVQVLKTAPEKILIDTAELYGKGKAETDICQAAKEAGLVLGKTGFVATKFAPQSLRLNADSVVSACKESAHRLGVDCIDLYQIHYADALSLLVQLGMPEKDEIYWEGLAKCYHEGLVSNVGVCNYGPTMIRRAHEALAKRSVPLVSNQINYNLMRYPSSTETKSICEELGITVLAYHPLGKGALTGKYDPNDETKMPRPRGQYERMTRWLKGTVPLRESLERIASEREKTCSQIAINWVACKGAIPIVGAKTTDQAADNFGALGWSLSEGEIEELEDAASKSVESWTVLGREFKLV